MDSLSSASDRLVLCLEVAEADLRAVAHRLEDEFYQRYSGKRVRGDALHSEIVSLSLAVSTAEYGALHPTHTFFRVMWA